MGRCVSPLVQFREMLQTRQVRRVGGEVKREAETVKIGFEMLQIRIPPIELAMGRELLLHERSQRGSHLRSDNLRGLGVQIATESLKVRTEQHDITSKILFDQGSVCRKRHKAGGALQISLLQ